ncbi:MAG TPA: permease-like cell division protein FtsX [Candidatus Paceibacterota bacterium]|nr:permease-like cell division protein FtsX [Candidatus Paceibacterota bacterium]
MTWVNIKRVSKAGFVSFLRNGMTSLSAVLVMFISLFIITSLVLSSALSSSIINMLKDKVDINVYFKSNATEEDILALKEKIELLPEVREATYVSSEESLANFKERHKDNSLILSSLDQLKDNPLGAVLSIKAKEPSQYEGIAKFLEEDGVSISADGSGIIDKINFYQNKLVIDRLTRLISATEKVGFSISLVFALIAIIVTLNTMQLAIYTAREEISVMRLVGAGNWYIRGPFIVSGVMAGLIASVLVLVIFYPITAWVGGKTADFLAGINLLNYYTANFLQIAAITIGSGILLGAVSALLSVRRYLHI